jgi:hypothetical protein
MASRVKIGAASVHFSESNQVKTGWLAYATKATGGIIIEARTLVASRKADASRSFESFH